MSHCHHFVFWDYVTRRKNMLQNLSKQANYTNNNQLLSDLSRTFQIPHHLHSLQIKTQAYAHLPDIHGFSQNSNAIT